MGRILSRIPTASADPACGNSVGANGWPVRRATRLISVLLASPPAGAYLVVRPLPNGYTLTRSGGRRGPPPGGPRRIATWLILPVVICLSQRLSHACLSISNYTVKLRMAH
jgi:hypothetical protein